MLALALFKQEALLFFFQIRQQILMVHKYKN